MENMLSRSKIYLCVFTVSVISKITFLFYWLNSPYRFFHKIPGLDMESLLIFSEWGPDKEFQPIFVAHRFMIYLVWLFNGQQHNVTALVILQSIVSAVSAVIVTDIVLMLWGKRITALCAGIFYALYAPLLLYDFCVLQESIATSLIISGIWGYLKCRSRHYPPWLSFFAGVGLGVCSVGRPVAVLAALFLPFWTFVSGKRKAGLRIAGGVFVLWLIAGVFNWSYEWGFTPFFNAVKYTVTFHSEKLADAPANSSSVPSSGSRSVKTPEKSSPSAASAVIRMVGGMPVRALKFFLAFEVPENINYYFLRSRITPLKLLPGPLLLVPIALAGILLMLLRIRHREFLILSVIILLALPLAAREPIGRYRLHLIPYFVICAAYFFTVLQKNTGKTHLLCGAALILSLGIQFAFWQPGFFRASDHVAWGKAIEAEAQGKVTGEAMKEYLLAWNKSNHTDRASAVNLITGSLKSGRSDFAVQICRQGISGPAKEKSIYHYYLAIIFTSVKQFGQAEQELAQVKDSEIPELRKKIGFLRNIVRRKSF